jgi:hypothetical protein
LDNSLPKYFAALPSDKAASELLTRARTFYQFNYDNGYLNKIRKMWLAYFGLDGEFSNHDSHSIKFTGEQGELAAINVNHFRNLAQHIYVMITSNRPTMEARAVNTDYKSLSQAMLANSILDYYMREKKLEDFIKKATEMAIVMGSSYVRLEWNATAGESYDYDEETGRFNYEGDLEFSVLSPFDVVFDGTKETYDNEWLLVRTYKNRFSLAAKYPELADKILGLPTKSDASVYRLSLFSNDKTDDIPVYEFFHKRTEALPNGRYLLFLDSDIVLLDTKLPYRTIPIFRIVPSEILGTPYGYSPMFDVFPICEATNALYSTILTNQNAFGVQNVFVPDGSNFNMSTLAGGLNVMTGTTPPVPVNLTQTPKEVFEYLQMMVKSAEVISGVNSVARGMPESSLKSGTALALVQSMALQFVSGLQQSYIQLIEDVGTNLINILKDFATTPKIVTLVGKNNKPYLQEFTGEKIDAVSRVIVSVGNPLSKTTAGRIQMVQEMTQMKLITNPQQYLQILNTGNLDVATEGSTNELLLIKKENEKMLDGTVPLVSPLDQHALHINEHRAVLADPDLRENPDLIRVVMDHIAKHMDALRNTDPELLAVTNQQSLMVPPMPEGNAGAVMQPMEGLPQAGDMISGPAGNAGLPAPATPPPPFEHLPTNAADLIPQ